MYICEKCNHFVSDTSTECPNCGTAVTRSSYVSAVEDSATTEINTKFGQMDDGERDLSVSKFETDASLPEQEPEPVQQTSKDDSEDNLLSATIKKGNALESSLDDIEYIKKSTGTSKLLIAVAVLSILALFSSAVLFILLPMRQQTKIETEIVDFLEGAWISDQFAFYDSTAKNFVEVLTVDKDGNYKMIYAVPDKEYPDGWRTDKWKIEDRIDGKVVFIKEEQRLLLLYEKDGVSYFYERFFILKDTDTICLREFYDETGENFYDVTLHRIKMQ